MDTRIEREKGKDLDPGFSVIPDVTEETECPVRQDCFSFEQCRPEIWSVGSSTNSLDHGLLNYQLPRTAE